MSYFVWTLRLAMIVEDILDIDITGPPIHEAWDQQFAAKLHSRHHRIRRAESIAEQLDLWRKDMPIQLEIDTSNTGPSPLPHHVIGLAVSLTDESHADGSGTTLPRSYCTLDSSSVTRAAPTCQSLAAAHIENAQTPASLWLIF